MRRDAGTSLLELIIMLAVAAVLCAGAALCLSRHASEADATRAQIEMERIIEEMDRHLLIPGRTPPRTLRELPGYEDAGPVDPWGAPYELQPTPGRIVSHGPDRRLDTTDPQRGPLGDDLVRDLPRPPRLPPVERAEGRRVGRWMRLCVPHTDFHADVTGSIDDEVHAFRAGQGRAVFREVLPARQWKRALVTVRITAEDSANVILHVNRWPMAVQRLKSGDGSGGVLTWDVPGPAVSGRSEIELWLCSKGGSLDPCITVDLEGY